MPPATTDRWDPADCANRRAYASLPRKYSPLTKLNTSPRRRPGVPQLLCKRELAASDMTCFARIPPQLAGESRKMRLPELSPAGYVVYYRRL